MTDLREELSRMADEAKSLWESAGNDAACYLERDLRMLAERALAARCDQPAGEPVPLPDCGSILVGHEEVSLGHSDEAMVKYAETVAASIEHRWRSFGIVEIAVRNPSVAEYMEHWEGRAETAERERDEEKDRADHLERVVSRSCAWPECNCKQSMQTKLVHCERLPIKILEDSASEDHKVSTGSR